MLSTSAIVHTPLSLLILLVIPWTVMIINHNHSVRIYNNIKSVYCVPFWLFATTWHIVTRTTTYHYCYYRTIAYGHQGYYSWNRQVGKCYALLCNRTTRLAIHKVRITGKRLVCQSYASRRQTCRPVQRLFATISSLECRPKDNVYRQL